MIHGRERLTQRRDGAGHGLGDGAAGRGRAEEVEAALVDAPLGIGDLGEDEPGGGGGLSEAHGGVDPASGNGAGVEAGE